jgi:hypothetical protein
VTIAVLATEPDSLAASAVALLAGLVERRPGDLPRRYGRHRDARGRQRTGRAVVTVVVEDVEDAADHQNGRHQAAQIDDRPPFRRG